MYKLQLFCFAVLFDTLNVFLDDNICFFAQKLLSLHRLEKESL